MIEFIKPFLNSTVGTTNTKSLDYIVEEQIHNLSSKLEFDGWNIDKLIVHPFNSGGFSEDIEIPVTGNLAEKFYRCNLIFDGTFKQFDLYIVTNPITQTQTSIISDVTCGYTLDYNNITNSMVFRTRSLYDSFATSETTSGSLISTLGNALENVGYPTQAPLYQNYRFACTLIKGRLIQLNKRA